VNAERDFGVRVGLGALLIEQQDGARQTGLSRYETQLAKHLTEYDDLDLRLYAQRGTQAGPGLEGTHLRTPPVDVRNPAARILWEQSGMAAQVVRDRLDLFHGLAFVVPPLVRTPSVVTVHDLAFMKVDGHAPARRVAYLTRMTKWSVERAARVIAVSHQTKLDIVEQFGIDQSLIDVTPLGVTGGLSPLSNEERAAFRRKHDLNRPTVLFLGTLEPRKNLPTLLRAFDQIAEELDAELVLAGAQGWLPDELNRALENVTHRGRIRITGFIPEPDLRFWLGSVDLFTFPSRYEGFGMPPLEAMACGTPVVASNASSLPGVLGDAAVLVSPDDVDGFAGAMERVLTDRAVAEDLRARGITRSARFSWAETARLTHASYRAARS
jgi:glycosyltransferase involved in cell wall biosynthesis